MIKNRPATSLLRMRWSSLKNQVSRPSPNKLGRWGLIFTLGTLFIIGDYLFFFRMIQYLDGLPLRIGEELIVQLLSVVFLTLFAMVLFSSLIASLSIFYISADLEFLHSLPVSKSSIITMRLGQTVINGTWVVWVFSMPIFMAYGYYFDVSAGYYFYLIGSFVPFVILPCILGVLGIMALMRHFPSQKIHQILSFLGLFFIACLVIFLRFLSPEKFFGKNVSDEMIIGFVDSLKTPEFSFLPSSWITRGLTAWVEGQTGESFIQMGFLYAACLVFFIVFYFVSKKDIFSRLENVQGGEKFSGKFQGQAELLKMVLEFDTHGCFQARAPFKGYQGFFSRSLAMVTDFYSYGSGRCVYI